jgi:hypothetical protein
LVSFGHEVNATTIGNLRLVANFDRSEDDNAPAAASIGRKHIGPGLVADVANEGVPLHPRNDRMRRDDDVNHFGAALWAQGGPRLGGRFGHDIHMPAQL